MSSPNPSTPSHPAHPICTASPSLVPPATPSPTLGDTRSTDDLCRALSEYPEISIIVIRHWEDGEGRVWGFKEQVKRMGEILRNTTVTLAADPPGVDVATTEQLAEVEQCMLTVIRGIIENPRPDVVTAGVGTLVDLLRILESSIRVPHFQQTDLMRRITRTAISFMKSCSNVPSLRDIIHGIAVSHSPTNFDNMDVLWYIHYRHGESLLQALGVYDAAQMSGSYQVTDIAKYWVLPWETWVRMTDHWMVPSAEELTDDQRPTRITFGNMAVSSEDAFADQDFDNWIVEYEQELRGPEDHGWAWMT